jgi:hypothetical protein
VLNKPGMPELQLVDGATGIGDTFEGIQTPSAQCRYRGWLTRASPREEADATDWSDTCSRDASRRSWWNAMPTCWNSPATPGSLEGSMCLNARPQS